MHPTYKHLEDRIRLAGLTLGQWSQLFFSALAAYALSRVLPLPGSWSLSVAISACGLPAAGAIAFGAQDFDVAGWVRAGIGFWQAPKDFRPGARPAFEGAGSVADPRALDVEALWDER